MDMCVMSGGDGPSEEQRPYIQYHRHHFGRPRPAWLNFSTITIAEGGKWQTLAILRTRSVFQEFVWVKSDPTGIFLRRVNPRACLVTLSATPSEQRRREAAWNIFTERPRRNRESLGCLFTLCIQSSFVTVPRFPKPQRDTSWRFHFWPRRDTPTHIMVPSYQIPLTITDSLQVRADV